MLAENVLKVLSGIFIGALVARYLGLEHFGIYSIIIAINAILIIVSKLGLENIIARDLVLKSDNYNTIISSSIVLKFTASFLVYFIVITSLYVVGYDYSGFVAIAAAPILISFSDITFSIYQNKLKLDTLSKVRIIQIVIVSLTRLFAVIYGFNLSQFVWIIFFDQFFLNIVYLLMLLKHNKLLGEFDRSYARDLMRNALPMVLIALSTTVYMRMDQFMVDFMLGSRATGLYTAAVKIAEAPIFLVLIISNISMPLFSKLFSENKSEFNNEINKWIKIVVKLALLIVISILLLSDNLIMMLYGRQFQESVIILKLYSFVLVFIYVNNISWIWIINNNYQKEALYKLLIGLCLNLVLNIVFIRMFDINGAVYATLVTYFMISFLMNALFKNLRPIFNLQLDAVKTLF